MIKRIYTHQEDCEEWYELGPEEAANEYIGAGYEVPEDGVISLYSGTPKSFKASDFFNLDVADHLMDNAYEEAGEHCDVWHFLLYEHSDELEMRMKCFIDEFCARKQIEPNFFKVENVREEQFKITIDEEGFVETIKRVE